MAQPARPAFHCFSSAAANSGTARRIAAPHRRIIAIEVAAVIAPPSAAPRKLFHILKDCAIICFDPIHQEGVR